MQHLVRLGVTEYLIDETVVSQCVLKLCCGVLEMLCALEAMPYLSNSCCSGVRTEVARTKQALHGEEAL